MTLQTLRARWQSRPSREGCMTAVTFFTIYNTWDRFDYDYHWILGLLT
ncbi:acyltransferase, partial [Klebsiella pneumoniae]|nr:acyltransferase [Klebsiella pneumoniae]